MKLKFNLIMMAMAIFMVACSDNDDPTPNPAQGIAGTYNGYSVGNERNASQTITTAAESIIIAANEDGTCQITFDSSQWGKFFTSTATVSFRNNTYEVEGSGRRELSVSPSEHTFTVKGSISSDKKTISLVFTTDEVTVTFTQGDAPANSLVAGTYEGYATATHGMTPVPTTVGDQSLTITANEDGTCDISFQSSAYGNATISAAQVTVSGDNYTISGEGETLMGMNPSNPSAYTTTLAGTINKDKSSVSLVFSTVIGGPMGTMEITFTQGEAPLSMLIANRYEGTLEVAVMGPPTTEDSQVTIVAQEDGKAEVTLSAFGEAPMAFEDIVVTDVEVSQEGGVYSLTGTIDVMNGQTNVTGNLAGTIEDGKANLVFTLKPGAMPMNIVATFTN